MSSTSPTRELAPAARRAAQRAADKVYKQHHYARDAATIDAAFAAAENAAENVPLSELLHTKKILDPRKVAKQVTLLGNENDVFWAQVQDTLHRKYKGSKHEVGMLVRGLRSLAEHEWRQWHAHRNKARREPAQHADDYLQAAANANTPHRARTGNKKKHTKKGRKKKKKKRR